MDLPLHSSRHPPPTRRPGPLGHRSRHTQILHIYAELIAIKQLNPSWPQIQRLVVCGQLLILCHESGELRSYEAQTLFGMVVDLLDKHAPTWPVCEALAEGFQRATRAFGESQVL